MKTLRSYPGLLTMLLVATALAVNGLVDYINYEIAGPSFLAAFALVCLSFVLIGVYEFRAFRRRNKKIERSPS